MKLRIASATALALSVLTVASAGTPSASAQATTRPATPMFGSNTSAWIDGMGAGDYATTSTDGNPLKCPQYDFCLFTQPGYRGTMFVLGYIGTQYTLVNWGGVGSYANTTTYCQFSLLNRSGASINDIPSIDYSDVSVTNWKNQYYNFSSASYATLCT